MVVTKFFAQMHGHTNTIHPHHHLQNHSTAYDGEFDVDSHGHYKSSDMSRAYRPYMPLILLYLL